MSLPPSIQIHYIIVDHTGSDSENHPVETVWMYPGEQINDIGRLGARLDPRWKNVPLGRLEFFKDMAAFRNRDACLPLEQYIDDLETSDANPLVCVIKLSLFDDPNATMRGHPLVEVAAQALESIALLLSYKYKFAFDRAAGPQFSDVLKARAGSEGRDWSLKRYKRDGLALRIFGEDPFPYKKGEPKTKIPLPRAFTENQWAFLEAVADSVAKKEGSMQLTYRQVYSLEQLGRYTP